MDIHPIIWLGIALLIIREIGEKFDWWRKRKRPEKWVGEAKPVALNPVVAPKPVRPRLGHRVDGVEDGVEVRWGRREEPADDPQFPVLEQDMIPFLEMHRDYALWYQIIHADIVGAVPEWILSQPDCPNAIAAAYINLLGPEIYGMTSKEADGYYLDPALRIISARDAANDFPADAMRDPVKGEPGFEWMNKPLSRAQLLERCEAIADRQAELGHTPHYPVPRNLLSVTPTGPQLRTEYYMDDTTIV